MKRHFGIFLCMLSLIYPCFSAPVTKDVVFGNNYCSEQNCPPSTTRCIKTDNTVDEYAITILHRIKCQDKNGMDMRYFVVYFYLLQKIIMILIRILF